MKNLSKKSFNQGFEAFNNAIPKSHNPYLKNETGFEQWNAGWLMALDEDVMRFKDTRVIYPYGIQGFTKIHQASK